MLQEACLSFAIPYLQMKTSQAQLQQFEEEALAQNIRVKVDSHTLLLVDTSLEDNSSPEDIDSFNSRLRQPLRNKVIELHSHTTIGTITDNSKDCITQEEDKEQHPMVASFQVCNSADTLQGDVQHSQIIPICKVYKNFEHQFKITMTIGIDVVITSSDPM